MKNILIDLSGEISETSVKILNAIEKVSKSLNFPFFVVGATARDFILEHQFDIQPLRATIDIDIGVFMSGWDQFNTLKNELIQSDRFVPTKKKQRLMYNDNFPVDIIPFGTIEDENGSITWPPDYDDSMSIMGFRESYANRYS